MPVAADIKAYLASLPAPKREDMQALHDSIQRWMPKARLWFLDGKDERGKVVSNPNIGYGVQTTGPREFYQVGISANSSGISVYIMGLPDRTYLTKTYASKLGKAKVTGYCIKFSALRNVDLKVLEAAVRDGVKQTSA